MPTVLIDCRKIHNGPTFHAVFAEAFGFPAFYGKNMDAWIDCMTSIDHPEHGMTSVHTSPPQVMVIQLDHADRLPKHFWDAIHDASAFVNYRRMEMGEPPVLAISAFRSKD